MSKRTLAIFYLVILLVTISFSALTSTGVTIAEGTLQWARTYGATNDEEARSVIQTADGGFVFTGYTEPYGPGTWDVWLVKTDAKGTPLWSQIYIGSHADVANSIIQTEDGGFALAGTTWSLGKGYNDGWLLKTNQNGTEAWNQTYGGSSWDGVHSVIQTADDGFALAAWTNSFGVGGIDAWLVKTDSSGAAQWDRTYGGTADDEAWTVIPMADGGYSLIGLTYSFGAGNADFWLVRTDAVGGSQWSRTYGGVNFDMAWAGIQTVEGGFALAGGTNSSGAGGNDAWLVKTDPNGVPQWNRTYGGLEDDVFYSIIQTDDGGFALSGFTNSSGAGYNDFWLVKTDAEGNEQWTQAYGGIEDEESKAVIQTADGGFLLAGFTNSVGLGRRDAWLVKVSTLPETTTPPKTITKTITVPEKVAVMPTILILAALTTLRVWKKKH